MNSRDGRASFDFPLVAEKTTEDLQEFGPRIETDYREFKERFLIWLINCGKDTLRGEGYSPNTVKTTHYKIEQVYRWHWEKESRYSLEFRPEDATDLIKWLIRFGNYEDSAILSFQKAIKRLFSYFNDQQGLALEWEHEYELSQKTARTRDYFRRREFRLLYDAALKYGSVKHYHNTTPEERDRIKGMLAKRNGIPKDKVGKVDWRKANGWKIPSLIGTCLDTGLRPIEVGRAKMDWVNLEDGELNIPKEEATKNDENWSPVLKNTTVGALARWLEERDSYEKYDGRDELWLTKRATPYNSNSLNYLLEKLVEQSDIDSRGRSLTFYSIRHGVATVWANSEGIHHAKEQMRHQEIETTMGYVHSSPEERSGKADSIW